MRRPWARAIAAWHLRQYRRDCEAEVAMSERRRERRDATEGFERLDLGLDVLALLAERTGEDGRTLLEQYLDREWERWNRDGAA